MKSVFIQLEMGPGLGLDFPVEKDKSNGVLTPFLFSFFIHAGFYKITAKKEI